LSQKFAARLTAPKMEDHSWTPSLDVKEAMQYHRYATISGGQGVAGAFVGRKLGI